MSIFAVPKREFRGEVQGGLSAGGRRRDAEGKGPGAGDGMLRAGGKVIQGKRCASRSKRRDAGVVDRAALEMRCTGNCTGGSNPSLSARHTC